MEKFLRIINDYLEVYLNPTDSLSLTGVDSLDLIEIVAKLESEYGVHFSDEAIDEFINYSYLPLSELYDKMKPYLNVKDS